MNTVQEILNKGYANKNYLTGRVYLGLLNQQKLQEAGHQSSERLTMYQIRQLGAKLKAGSKGVKVFYQEPYKVINKETGEEEDTIHYIQWIVFNLDCIELPQTTGTTVSNNSKMYSKITTKQESLLRRLILQNIKDRDEADKAIANLPNLSKGQANQMVKRYLQKTSH